MRDASELGDLASQMLVFYGEQLEAIGRMVRAHTGETSFSVVFSEESVDREIEVDLHVGGESVKVWSHEPEELDEDEDEAETIS